MTTPVFSLLFATAKRLAKATLYRRGPAPSCRYSLKQPTPTISPIFDDPFKALHRHQAGKGAAFHCPLDQCVMFNGFNFARDGWNPFSATLDEYRAGLCHRYQGSLLQRYYATWQPADALEALIGLKEEPSTFTRLPSHLHVWPWAAGTLRQLHAEVQSWYDAEMRAYGQPHLTLTEHGFKLHGPTHIAIGTIEFSRLTTVFNSIAQRGYIREEGDVDVLMVQRGHERRYLFQDGLHRMAAMRALGHDTIPARFRWQPWLVDLADIDDWPQVRCGIWSPAAARLYIDHLFDSAPRPWAAARDLLPRCMASQKSE